MRLAYDFETNGLFADSIRPTDKHVRIIDRVHCLVTQDIDTGEVQRYANPYTANAAGLTGIQDKLSIGVRTLLAADLRVAHNGQEYDERVLREFFPAEWAARNPNAQVLDSLVGAEVVWPFEWLKGRDAERMKRGQTAMPPALIGKHSLEAWGWRLGNRKAGYEGDFSELTQAMLDYCVQDVSSLVSLFRKLEDRIKADRFSWRAWELEQAFKAEIAQQMKNGVLYDVAASDALTARLQGRRAELQVELAGIFPPKVLEYVTPKKKQVKHKTVLFNPGSRQQIAERIQEQGWRPPSRGGYTPSGDVKIDEQVLAGLKKYTGVPQLIEYLLVNKRLSQLSEPASKTAVPWAKMVQADGRIHGQVRHNAAITNRCTHAKPNMTAVPRVGSPYGEECRALFVAGPGNKLIGGDLKGIQLRVLAHHLAFTDGGAFVREVLEGDPHDGTRAAIGLPPGKSNRDKGKELNFAVQFGAGPGKVMEILGCNYQSAKRALDLLLKNRPHLAAFKRKLHRLHAERGCLKGPDGRYAFTRSGHSSIATALQLGEAVLMKLTVVKMHAKFRAEGLNVRQVLSVHDEVVLEAPEAQARRVADIFLETVPEAGLELGFRCPMAGDAKIGNSWLEVH